MSAQYLRIRLPDDIGTHLEDVKKNRGLSKNAQVIIALEEKIAREQPAEVAKPKAKRRIR